MIEYNRGMRDINLVYFVVGVLATYRLTSLLHREVGPFKMMAWIRARFGVLNDYDGYPHGYPETMWGKLFECFWCLSVWVATGVTLVIALGGWWILLPLALSGGAILCVEGVEK
jgi:hypothetical protein